MNIRNIALSWLIAMISFSVFTMETPREMLPFTVKKLLSDGFLNDATSSPDLLKTAQGMREHNPSMFVELVYQSARLRNVEAFYALGNLHYERDQLEQAAEWFYFGKLIHWYRTGNSHEFCEKRLQAIYSIENDKQGFSRNVRRKGSWAHKIHFMNLELPKYEARISNVREPQTQRMEWFIAKAQEMFFSSVGSRFEQLALVILSDQHIENNLTVFEILSLNSIPNEGMSADVKRRVMAHGRSLEKPDELSSELCKTLLIRLMHNAVRAALQTNSHLGEIYNSSVLRFLYHLDFFNLEGPELSEAETECFQVIVKYFLFAKAYEFYSAVYFGYAKRIFVKNGVTSEMHSRLISHYLSQALNHANREGLENFVQCHHLEFLFKGLIETELTEEDRLKKVFTLAATMGSKEKDKVLELLFVYEPDFDQSSEYAVYFWRTAIAFLNDYLVAYPKRLYLHRDIVHAYKRLTKHFASFETEEELVQAMELAQELEARFVIYDTVAYVSAEEKESVDLIVDLVRTKHKQSLKRARAREVDSSIVGKNDRTPSNTFDEQCSDDEEKEKERERDIDKANEQIAPLEKNRLPQSRSKKDRKAEKQSRARHRHQQRIVSQMPGKQAVEARDLPINFINARVEKAFKQIESSKKVKELFADIALKPWGTDGSGRPEILRGGGRYKGCYSREIDKKNRLVYKIDAQAITIYLCEGHYGS